MLHWVGPNVQLGLKLRVCEAVYTAVLTGEGDKTRLIKREGGREGPRERKVKENTCSMRCCIQSRHLKGGRLIKRRGSKKVRRY